MHSRSFFYIMKFFVSTNLRKRRVQGEEEIFIRGIHGRSCSSTHARKNAWLLGWCGFGCSNVQGDISICKYFGRDAHEPSRKSESLSKPGPLVIGLIFGPRGCPWSRKSSTGRSPFAKYVRIQALFYIRGSACFSYRSKKLAKGTFLCSRAGRGFWNTKKECLLVHIFPGGRGGWIDFLSLNNKSAGFFCPTKIKNLRIAESFRCTSKFSN